MAKTQHPDIKVLGQSWLGWAVPEGNPKLWTRSIPPNAPATLAAKAMLAERQWMEKLQSDPKALAALRDVLLFPVPGSGQEPLQYSISEPDFPCLQAPLIQADPAALRVFLGEMRAATQALETLHKAGYAHCAISPGALLHIGTDYRWAGMGFALAASEMKPQPELISSAVLLSFMAPELTGRISSNPDFRADLYALGACFYYRLCGHPPVSGGDLSELLHAVLTQAPAPLERLIPGLPPRVSSLFTQLLAKAPEQRPPSATALLHVLDSLLAELDSGALRSEDAATKVLRLPARVFGRAHETALLDEALSEAAQGHKSMLLIVGPAGIGKSALAMHLQQACAQSGGTFMHGKFQQYNRASPYLGLVEALNSALNRLLTLEESAFEARKQALIEALGSNAAAFASFLPGVEWLIGRQAPQTGDEASEELSNRIKRALRAFMQQFAETGKPAVLLLDDVQWAGLPTFNLLEVLVEQAQLDHFLLVLTMRSGELSETHPLHHFCKLSSANLHVREISLGPLSDEVIGSILAETLGMTAEKVAPLARVVLQKTGGNPLFTREFILRLYRQHLIVYRNAQQQWDWDLSAIQRSEVSGGAALIAEQFQHLPEAVRRTLQHGACFGHTFSSNRLRALFPISAEDMAATLHTAIDTGILLPPSEPGSDAYRFAHDMLQQAAYDALSNTEKSEAHYQIARDAVSRLKPEQMRGDAFEILFHFSHCLDKVVEPELRLMYVRLSIEAARKDKASLAFQQAYDVLHKAKKMLAQFSHPESEALSGELDIALYEAAAFLGLLDEAAELHQEAMRRAQDPLLKVRLHLAKARVHIARSELPETLDACRDGLRLLDIRLPQKGSTFGVLIEFLRTQWFLRGKSIEDLKRLPLWEGPASDYLSQLLYLSLHPAYVQAPSLFGILSLKALQAAVRHGVGRHSFLGFSTYSAFMAVGFDNFKRAAAIHSVATATAEKLKSEEPIVYAGRAFAQTYEGHIRGAFQWSAKSHSVADAAGLLREASEPLPLDTMARFHAGLPLAEVEQTGLKYLEYIAKSGTSHLYDSVLVAVRGIRRLRGMPEEGLVDIDGMPLDDARLHSILHDTPYLTIRAYHLLLEVQALVLDKRIALAAKRIAALRKIAHSVSGSFTMTEIVFLDGLIAALRARDLGGWSAWRVRRWAKGRLRKMRKWASAVPENYRHKVWLVEALLEKDSGQAVEALSRAHDEALQGQFLFHAAFAAEMAGEILAQEDRMPEARPYLENAYRHYDAWGADPQWKALALRYPELFPAKNPEAAAAPISSAIGSIDLIAILKASNTISSEISLSGLLSRLIRILTEYAGAERGMLLLEEKGEWLIQARSEQGNAEIKILEAIPAEESGLLPRSILTLVARRREAQVITDAASTPELADDPYVRKQRPRSVLCLPILNQAQLAGILYLENNLTTGAFSKDRLEVLDILAAQAAVSLENVRLYLELEARVEERTSALKETLENLRATQDQLVQSEKLASLGQVTAGIAHEIRNPLNFVNNFSELTVELADELSQELEGLLGMKLSESELELLRGYLSDIKGNSDKIRHHGKRAESIIHNMLLHAASGTGERTLVDINQLAHEYALLAYHGIRGMAKGFQCQLEFQLDPQVGQLEINQQDISRALLNILQNAFQAMEEHSRKQGADYKPHLILRTEDLGQQLRIVVRDNGPGIPEAVRDRIFDPFFTTKPTGKGTGLGLSLAYDLVVQGHQGQLKLDSKDGEFTEFSIYLPRKS